MRKEYPWTRFWTPRDAELTLYSDAYLPDPEDPYSRFHNLKASTFKTLSAEKCNVLLGEGGMGKSRSLERDHACMVALWEAQNEHGFLIDLAVLANPSDLNFRLQQDAIFQTWLHGDRVMHLTLDSLDEALPFQPNLPKILLGVLDGLPREGLRFSIACRSVAWLPFFEDGLRTLFGSEGVHVWRLAPLRQEDVKIAAAASGLDGERFLRAVAEKNVEPLAAHPLTLELLLRSVSGGASFPDDLAELYERGCRTFLFEPPDSSRAAATPRMDADQMIAVAGRIACATLFGARPAVDTNEVDACPPDAVRIGDLASGCETVRGTAFDVGTLDVWEVIHSGLFTRSGFQFRWTHKSFAEFLAAHHLRTESTSLSQIMKLLRAAGQVAPALSGVAAWLAAMREDVLAEILRTDPEVLLEADLTRTSAAVRAELVDFLVRQAEAENPFIYQWGLFWKYRKLKHPGLKEQLGPRLDVSQPATVRKLAADIANACGEAGLSGKLVDITLNEGEPLFLRLHAAWCVTEHGSADEKARLRPLALKPGSDKDQQHLQAQALSAVWPTHVTWQEIRDSLGTRDYEQTDAVGRFLAHDFVQGLPEREFADCLAWLAREHSNPNALSGWAGAADQLILRAMNHVDDAAIRRALADLLAARVTGHYLVFDSRGISRRERYTLGSADKRRQLASELVPRLSGKTYVGWPLLREPAPLLLPSDLEFAVEEWKKAGPEIRPNWECIVGSLTDWETPGVRSRVFALTADRPDLKAALRCWWLNRRRGIRCEEERKTEEQETSARKRSARIRRLQYLITLSERNPRAVSRLLELMSAPLESDIAERLFHPNLRELAGWSVLTAPETTRLVDAAKWFLAEGPSYTARSIRHGGPGMSELAAYKILRDRIVHEPEYLTSLPAPVLSKWIPGILLCQISGTNEELDEPDRALRDVVLARAPEVVHWATALILRRDRIHNPDRALQWLTRERQSLQLDQIIFDAINRPTASENLYIAGLRVLFEHGLQEAEKLAKDNLALLNTTGGNDRRIACSTAVWVGQCHEQAWPAVWSEMKSNGGFAKAVLEVMCSTGNISTTLGAWLPESDCADLYRWLRSTFGAPPNSDLFHRDAVHTVQGNILHWLQERSTAVAVAVLDQLEREYPADWWIRKATWEARRGLIQSSWQPLDPATVIQVIQDRRYLLVRDEMELMEDLLEALDELQVRLRDTGDRVRRLWNEYHVGRSLAYKPKPEEPVSREIALELADLLKRRGVTATLETKIREGEYVDIHVSAMTASSVPKWISLIIEVKGCWNPAVRTALDSQLAERYLKNKQSPFGIYLVAWFTCEQWDSRDTERKSLASRDTLEDLKAFLEAEAKRVSAESAVCIRSFVLDATLPGVRPKPKSGGKHGTRSASRKKSTRSAVVKRRA